MQFWKIWMLCTFAVVCGFVATYGSVQRRTTVQVELAKAAPMASQKIEHLENAKRGILYLAAGREQQFPKLRAAIDSLKLAVGQLQANPYAQIAYPKINLLAYVLSWYPPFQPWLAMAWALAGAAILWTLWHGMLWLERCAFRLGRRLSRLTMQRPFR